MDIFWRLLILFTTATTCPLCTEKQIQFEESIAIHQCPSNTWNKIAWKNEDNSKHSALLDQVLLHGIFSFVNSKQEFWVFTASQKDILTKRVKRLQWTSHNCGVTGSRCYKNEVQNSSSITVSGKYSMPFFFSILYFLVFAYCTFFIPGVSLHGHRKPRILWMCKRSLHAGSALPCGPSSLLSMQHMLPAPARETGLCL